MTRPLLPHPAGWTVTTLEPDANSGFVIEAASGSTPPTDANECWGGAIPWLTPKEVTESSTYRFVAATERTITEEGLRHAGRLWPQRTVMLTKRAPVGCPVLNSIPI